MLKFRWRYAVACGFVAATPWAGAAAEAGPPSGVVNLSSSASVEVTKDLLSVTLGTVREGPDASSVQSQLKQALDAALAEARKSVRAGQLEVQTGNFSMSPKYTNKGVLNGWQGNAELTLEGRDLQAIGQLTGRLTTLSISRVGYNLSRELREKSESEVASQAIASYRGKAAEYARQFGYTGYVLREVNVSTNEGVPVRLGEAPRMRALSVSADESLPVEPGKGTVTVTVSGSVQLVR